MGKGCGTRQVAGEDFAASGSEEKRLGQVGKLTGGGRRTREVRIE
jgi:hypothetical protein